MAKKTRKKTTGTPPATRPRLVQHSFFLTEAQHAELANLAERLNCVDVPEMFNKLLEFGKLYGKALDNGYELFVVDPKETKAIQSKQDSRMMFLFNSPKAFTNISHYLASTLNINRAIKDSNMFGLPFDAGDA